MIQRVAILCLVLLLSVSAGIKKTLPEEVVSSNDALTSITKDLYIKTGLKGVLSYEAFQRAVQGVKQYSPAKTIVAVCDFSKPSTQERFFVIDMQKGEVLLKSLVAHGKNSGELMATVFSNQPQSLQSSLGFYQIGEVIQSPKHGIALLLEGLEKGVNHNARQREVIIHGADYVSEAFIAAHGRLGRSFGCPALPNEVMKKAAPLLCNGALLYVFAKQ